MLSPLAKILLTSTSIAPVGLVYAWVAFWQEDRFTAAIIAAISLVLVPICHSLINYSRRTIEKFSIKIQSIEPSDKENTGFLLLYLLPLFTDKINTLNWVVWIPMLAIFAALTATGYNYHFNPLLSLLGWHFYRIQSDGVTYVLITRRHLRAAVGTLVVAQLTEYILLDVEG
ncbi:hypothetical protein [Xanthobacter autotrophicus]|uniref:hypothetical protein n=1 Tax=Xanthobacter autotrophicus TaxID=280 RepID=UPI00372902EF